MRRNSVQSTGTTVRAFLLEILKGTLPHIHILHTHNNVAVLAQKCTIEIDNEDIIGIVHDLEFSNDPFAHFLVCLDVDDLKMRHISICQWCS